MTFLFHDNWHTSVTFPRHKVPSIIKWLTSVFSSHVLAFEGSLSSSLLLYWDLRALVVCSSVPPKDVSESTQNSQVLAKRLAWNICTHGTSAWDKFYEREGRASHHKGNNFALTQRCWSMSTFRTSLLRWLLFFQSAGQWISFRLPFVCFWDIRDIQNRERRALRLEKVTQDCLSPFLVYENLRSSRNMCCCGFLGSRDNCLETFETTRWNSVPSLRVSCD